MEDDPEWEISFGYWIPPPHSAIALSSGLVATPSEGDGRWLKHTTKVQGDTSANAIQS